MTNELVKQIAEQGEQMDYGISFKLLSKPTLELSDHELLLIANDLRAKRVKFLKGVKDLAGSTARKRAAPISDEEKAARTAHLKEQLKLGGLGGLEI